MKKNSSRPTIESFSDRLEKILSTDSNNKEQELHNLACELAQNEKKEAKLQNGRKNIFIFTWMILIASIVGLFLLMDRNDALCNKIEDMEYRDSLFNQILEPDSTFVITYRVRNGKPITYHQLEAEKDSLQTQYNDLASLKEHYRIEVGLATRNYPISFTKEGNVYTIHASKIDSALLLLPVYRDMIEYDKHTDTWTVSRVHYK